MNYNDTLVQLLKNLSNNMQDDTDPNNVLIQKFQAPSENNQLGESVSTVKWGGAPYWVGALPATFLRNSPAYNLDGSYAGYNPRFAPGKFGQGILVEEGTTNLASTYRDISSWDRGSGIASVSSNSENFRGNVSYIVKALGSGTGYTFVRKAIGSTQGLTYTGTFYVKKINWRYIGFRVFLNGTAGPTQAVLDFDTATVYANNSQNTISAVAVENGWWQITVTNVGVLDSSSPYLGICLPIDTGGAEYTTALSGQQVAISNIIQAEQKSYATTFSDSTRQAESLTIPTSGVLNTQQGTIEVYVYVNANLKDLSANRYILASAVGSAYPYNNSIALSHNTGNAWCAWITDANGNQSYIAINDTLSIGWHQFVVRWSSASFDLFIDGTKQATKTNPSLPSAFNTNLVLGQWQWPYGWINTYIDDLRISNIARSDSDILNAYNSNQPLSVDSYTTAKYNFDGNLNNAIAMTPTFNWSQGGSYAQKMEVYKCLMLI